jgi:hypothetical protein
VSFFTYMACDDHDAVLYVGRATRKEVWRRFAEHKKRSDWYNSARYINVYEHLTHEAMRAHEQVMWRQYSPPFNRREPGHTGSLDYSILGCTTYNRDALGRWHLASYAS